MLYTVGGDGHSQGRPDFRQGLTEAQLAAKSERPKLFPFLSVRCRIESERLAKCTGARHIHTGLGDERFVEIEDDSLDHSSVPTLTCCRGRVLSKPRQEATCTIHILLITVAKTCDEIRFFCTGAHDDYAQHCDTDAEQKPVCCNQRKRRDEQRRR